MKEEFLDVDTRNNWEKLSTEVVYENPWIEVQHHQVITPAGTKGTYGQVEFKNIAVGVVPIDNELNTYLVGQYRFPIDEYSWEIPEGGSPKNEDPLNSAKRELLEETGLKAGKWTKIGRVHTSNSVCNETGIIYIAENLSMGKAHPEETEVLSLRKIPLKTAIQMVMENKITDAISVAALLKVKILLNID